MFGILILLLSALLRTLVLHLKAGLALRFQAEASLATPQEAGQHTRPESVSGGTALTPNLCVNILHKVSRNRNRHTLKPLHARTIEQRGVFILLPAL